MSDPVAVDRYFTEQVVGRELVVTMGPRAYVHEPPANGAWVSLVEARTGIYGLAARSLMSSTPLRMLAGRPFSLPALLAARGQLVLAGWGAMAGVGLVAWTAALWFLVPWLQR